MKKLLWLLVLVLMPAMMFSACSSSSSDNGAAPSLNASGGNGTFGYGGDGGAVLTEATGTITIAASGAVDASFVESDPTATNFGTNAPVLSAGTTTIELVTDLSTTYAVGTLCTLTNDASVYLITDTTNTCGVPATLVTGIRVPAGSTLVLPANDDASIDLDNDILIEGTVQTAAGALEIFAHNIEVGAGGQVTTSATTADTSAKPLMLFATNKLINHGTIADDGNGTGNASVMTLLAYALVENTGTIEVNGGNGATAGGNSSLIMIEVLFGDFRSSGRISANGGIGSDDHGGNGGLIEIITAAADNSATSNGDMRITGTLELNGGNGTNGYGGSAGQFLGGTGALGNVLMNAAVSAKGGDGLSSTATTSATAIYNGGHGGMVQLLSMNDASAVAITAPGKIRVGGTFDFRGGNGDLNGGDAGVLMIEAMGVSTDGLSGVDVDLVLPWVLADGGIGATYGGDGGGAELYTESSNTVANVSAGPITNQATIQAMGGVATNLTGTGGAGGMVEMVAGTDYAIAPLTVTAITVVDNQAPIYTSGGNGGAIGGNGYGIGFVGQHVTTSADLWSLGGNGTDKGGNGGIIQFNSLDLATKSTGTNLSHVGGGTGATNGLDGSVIVTN